MTDAVNRDIRRGVCCGQTKQYANRYEREAAMEKILIEMSRFKDSRGLAVPLPWIGDIINIYDQAENDRT